jgi:hypothetical protein
MDAAKSKREASRRDHHEVRPHGATRPYVAHTVAWPASLGAGAP